MPAWWPMSGLDLVPDAETALKIGRVILEKYYGDSLADLHASAGARECVSKHWWGDLRVSCALIRQPQEMRRKQSLSASRMSMVRRVHLDCTSKAWGGSLLKKARGQQAISQR